MPYSRSLNLATYGSGVIDDVDVQTTESNFEQNIHERENLCRPRCVAAEEKFESKNFVPISTRVSHYPSRPFLLKDTKTTESRQGTLPVPVVQTPRNSSPDLIQKRQRPRAASLKGTTTSPTQALDQSRQQQGQTRSQNKSFLFFSPRKEKAQFQTTLPKPQQQNVVYSRKHTKGSRPNRE